MPSPPLFFKDRFGGVQRLTAIARFLKVIEGGGDAGLDRP
jgi:hypothetical protein